MENKQRTNYGSFGKTEENSNNEVCIATDVPKGTDLNEIKETATYNLDETEKLSTGLVRCMKLKLRKKPGFDAEVIGLLEENTEVVILSDRGDWLEVQKVQGSEYGYVYKEYIKEV